MPHTYEHEITNGYVNVGDLKWKIPKTVVDNKNQDLTAPLKDIFTRAKVPQNLWDWCIHSKILEVENLHSLDRHPEDFWRRLTVLDGMVPVDAAGNPTGPPNPKGPLIMPAEDLPAIESACKRAWILADEAHERQYRSEVTHHEHMPLDDLTQKTLEFKFTEFYKIHLRSHRMPSGRLLGQLYRDLHRRTFQVIDLNDVRTMADIDHGTGSVDPVKSHAMCYNRMRAVLFGWTMVGLETKFLTLDTAHETLDYMFEQCCEREAGQRPALATILDAWKASYQYWVDELRASTTKTLDSVLKSENARTAWMDNWTWQASRDLSPPRTIPPVTMTLVAPPVTTTLVAPPVTTLVSSPMTTIAAAPVTTQLRYGATATPAVVQLRGPYY